MTTSRLMVDTAAAPAGVSAESTAPPPVINVAAAYEAMNRRKLVEAVQAHNDRVQVIRSYSRKSKDALLKELRAVYPLTVAAKTPTPAKE